MSSTRANFGRLLLHMVWQLVSLPSMAIRHRMDFCMVGSPIHLCHICVCYMFVCAHGDDGFWRLNFTSPSIYVHTHIHPTYPSTQIYISTYSPFPSFHPPTHSCTHPLTFPPAHSDHIHLPIQCAVIPVFCVLSIHSISLHSIILHPFHSSLGLHSPPSTC